MKIKYNFILIFLSLSFSGCEKFLDRPQLTSENDETAWKSEDNVRLYANKYYTDFFTGYGLGFDNGAALLAGYTFSDDVLLLGNQTNFTRSIPNSQIWSYTTIRSVNVMLNRIENRMSKILSSEAFNHWKGIGKFFRAMRYSELVGTYGDVPYYDDIVSDVDFDNLYKARTPRNEVMDAVYEDLKFALANVRLNDGDQFVNRYVVAGFVSRLAMTEGSWQKYYYKNQDRAKKFYELALEAANFVISSGKYDIVSDYRSIFTSNDLKGNKDVILYRHYDAAVNIRHSIVSIHNLSESVTYGPTTSLIKSFLCSKDGQPWQNSVEKNAHNFSLDSLIAKRDSRFEASFHYKNTIKNKASFLYITKFLPRSVQATVAAGGAPGIDYSGSNNVTDAPVLRYAEVLLNWIETKAELASLGGVAVDQSDIDRTINKLRDRPLAAEAASRGVKKTARLQLTNLPVDPARDVQVSSLLWEIRRERRMELTFEESRLSDLKRWSKLEYMDTDLNKDLLSGGWVNFPQEVPAEIKAGISVVKLDGQVVVFNPADASSSAKMTGFYRYTLNNGRQPFLNLSNINPYLAPVGRVQIDEYAAKGYVLKQTEGWPQN